MSVSWSSSTLPGSWPSFVRASLMNAPYGFPDSVVMAFSSLIVVPLTAPDSALRLMPTGAEYETGSSPHAAHNAIRTMVVTLIVLQWGRTWRRLPKHGSFTCYTCANVRGVVRAHVRRSHVRADRRTRRDQRPKMSLISCGGVTSSCSYVHSDGGLSGRQRARCEPWRNREPCM